MPRTRPATTGYERLAQADMLSDDSDDSDDEGILSRSYASLQPAAAPRYAPVTQPRPRSGMSTPGSSSALAAGAGQQRPAPARPRPPQRRLASGSGVDLKAINARLERWADEIAARFKRRRSGRGENGADDDDERLEIHHSVFQPPEGVRPVTAEALAAGPRPAMAEDRFEQIVESVRVAIERGVHPRMISQGSSGSYFARNPDGKVVGVFKPKDEEPYAAGNPKWNKWIHRNLFPCCFGRACLIPNLSYISEAAAYTLDCQLRTHIVPYTDVVCLSSKSFHYPFWDRHAFGRKRKPLPAKPGSFQVFLGGFRDANVFLREHPWPDQHWSNPAGGAGGGGGGRAARPRRERRWANSCRPATPVSAADGDACSDDDDGDHNGSASTARPPGPGKFVWTGTLKQSFREELEKLVILDYIMRNTDRGLDNWMIKVDWEAQRVAVASEPMHLNLDAGMDQAVGQEAEEDRAPRPANAVPGPTASPNSAHPYRPQRPMEASAPSGSGRDPVMSIGAIDNSLSWPWKHPDAWRSFPFGWLFLPVDLIGRPFSQRTRDHFLPLLTSTAWWSQTQLALRRVFMKDPDFQERMFARQMAVMKGQAWNVVETLKTADHGPLELTRRAKVCVWDDLVDVPVAVPMRVSTDMRARDPAGQQETGATMEVEIDEVDIGASISNPAISGGGRRKRTGAPPDPDRLLGAASPPADMPHPGRFEVNSSPSAVTPSIDQGRSPAETLLVSEPGEAAAAADFFGPSSAATTTAAVSAGAAAPAGRSGRRPAHLQPARSHRQQQQQAAMRRGSFGRIGARTIAQYLEDDEFDGDLGYAAAEDMEGSRRRVIVERLEPVRTRNPVFTCW